MAECKYPRDVAVSRQKQTLSIASYLYRAEAEKGESPKMLFGHFSRYVVTIINEGKQALSANISPIDFVGPIAERSKAYYARELNGVPAPVQTNGSSSPATTVTFFAGEFKGKTPAQILLEHPDGSCDQKLKDQWKWLKSNLEKFPKNQTVMDAIADAFNLRKAGKLEGGTSAPATSAGKVYASGVRPNMYKGETRNGVQMYPVYEININWNFGKNYPVEVEILRYFAPVEKKEDGRLNVGRGSMDKASFQKNAMNLAADEWIRMLKLIELDTNRFNMLSAKTIENEVAAVEKANFNGNNNN